MALTLSQLMAKRDELMKIKLSGVQSVSTGDNSATMRSMKDINEALATIDSEIAALSATRRVRAIRITTKDGW